MQLTTFPLLGVIFLAVSPVLSTPVSSQSIQARSNIPAFGDGRYSLATAEDGSVTLSFTPMALVQKRAATHTFEDTLEKRAGVSCQGGSLNPPDVNTAYDCLEGLGNPASWAYHEVVWVSI
jgi:hypothetical protein